MHLAQLWQNRKQGMEKRTMILSSLKNTEMIVITDDAMAQIKFGLE